MGRLQLWLAIMFVLVFVGHSRAQGTISWTCGYPKSSSNTQAIDVKGSITLDTGWTQAGTATVIAWKDGTEETVATVLVCGSSFDSYIGGLISGDTYNVTVEIVLTDSCANTVIIRTAVRTASAS